VGVLPDKKMHQRNFKVFLSSSFSIAEKEAKSLGRRTLSRKLRIVPLPESHPPAGGSPRHLRIVLQQSDG